MMTLRDFVRWLARLASDRVRRPSPRRNGREHPSSEQARDASANNNGVAPWWMGLGLRINHCSLLPSN